MHLNLRCIEALALDIADSVHSFEPSQMEE